MSQIKSRDQIIVKTSILSIFVNAFLAVFKVIIGLAANSIAVILDAVNNISDGLSSIITIVGTKLAGMSPNKKHPLGYGRMEYLSSLVVAAIVFYAGITSVVESVKKIIHPEKATYTRVALIIIAVAVLAKFFLGIYVKNTGKKISSAALVASGSEAFFDGIVSASVLASALIYTLTGISLEAYVGVLIGLMIIKSGLELIIETLNDILGKRADAETTKELKSFIAEDPEIRGAYDLIIHNYGPDRNIASVHVEVPDTMTIAQMDELTRRIEQRVYQEKGIVLVAIGVYAYNTKNDEAAKMRDQVSETILKHDWALQMHGFYVNFKEKTMRFDVVMNFGIDMKEGKEEIINEVSKLYPDFKVNVTIDLDITD